MGTVKRWAPVAVVTLLVLGTTTLFFTEEDVPGPVSPHWPPQTVSAAGLSHAVIADVGAGSLQEELALTRRNVERLQGTLELRHKLASAGEQLEKLEGRFQRLQEVRGSWTADDSSAAAKPVASARAHPARALDTYIADLKEGVIPSSIPPRFLDNPIYGGLVHRKRKRGTPTAGEEDRYCRFLLFNTRKAPPPYCTWVPPRCTFPALVTGLAGAGLHKTAAMLKYASVKVEYADIRRDGAVSWQFAVNDAGSGVPYPSGEVIPTELSSMSCYLAPGQLHGPRFRRVLHQLSCPIKHISEFTSHSRADFEFIWETLAGDRSAQHVDQTRQFSEPGASRSSSSSSGGGGSSSGSSSGGGSGGGTSSSSGGKSSNSKRKSGSSTGSGSSSGGSGSDGSSSGGSSGGGSSKPRTKASKLMDRLQGNGPSQPSKTRGVSQGKSNNQQSGKIRRPKSLRTSRRQLQIPTGVNTSNLLAMEQLPSLLCLPRVRSVSDLARDEKVRPCLSLLGAAARAWLAWNEHIEMFADAVIRAEDATLESLCSTTLCKDDCDRRQREAERQAAFRESQAAAAAAAAAMASSGVDTQQAGAQALAGKTTKKNTTKTKKKKKKKKKRKKANPTSSTKKKKKTPRTKAKNSSRETAVEGKAKKGKRKTSADKSTPTRMLGSQPASTPRRLSDLPPGVRAPARNHWIFTMDNIFAIDPDLGLAVMEKAAVYGYWTWNETGDGLQNTYSDCNLSVSDENWALFLAATAGEAT